MDVDALAPRDASRAVRWSAHLLYLASIGILFVNSTPRWFNAPLQVIVLTVLLPLVVAAVLVRKRHPYLLPVLGLAGMAAGTFSVFIVGAMSLAARRAGPFVWAITAAGAVGAATLIVTRDLADGAGPGDLVLGAVLSGAVVAVAPTLVGGYIRAHRRLAASVAERAVRAELEQELGTQRALHTERERIAQDMHDSLGHVLALISMQAGALEVQARDPESTSAARQIRESARAGLRELRSVVHALGADDRRDPVPELAAIPDLVAASRGAGADVRLSDTLTDRTTLPSSVGRLAYQSVQEALTNAHRHAPGAAVDIMLDGAPGAGVDVVVSNPLVPGGERGAGTGLARLRNRVEVLGGGLDARASHGRYELRVRLPWEAAS